MNVDDMSLDLEDENYLKDLPQPNLEKKASKLTELNEQCYMPADLNQQLQKEEIPELEHPRPENLEDMSYFKAEEVRQEPMGTEEQPIAPELIPEIQKSLPIYDFGNESQDEISQKV